MNNLNLEEDWIREVKKFLEEHKFKNFDSLSNTMLAMRVNNYFRKGGMNFKWNIKLPKDFYEKINVNEDEKNSINDILKELSEGKGVYEYLSVNSKNLKKLDYLFNRWEITHLHLDKMSEIKRNKRSKKLLFIHFDYNNSIARVIGIYEHNRWFDKDVLKDFINLYPEIISVKNIGKKVIEILTPDLYSSKEELIVLKLIFEDGSSEIIIGSDIVSTGDSGWDSKVVNQFFVDLHTISEELYKALKIDISNDENLELCDVKFNLKVNEDLKMNFSLIDIKNGNLLIDFGNDFDVIILRYSKEIESYKK